MKKIGARIEDGVADEYISLYPNLHAGTYRAVLSWLHLRKKCLSELKGVFRIDELKYLIESQRGYSYDPAYAAMAESIEMRVKQGPDNKTKETLLVKVAVLRPGYAMVLTDWIDCYLRSEKKLTEVELREILEDLL